MSICDKEIRMRILEGLLPGLTRLGVNDPDRMTVVAKDLEKYVQQGYNNPCETSNSPSESKSVTNKVVRQPRKKKVLSPKSGDNSTS